jgi:hypothetical protein
MTSYWHERQIRIVDYPKWAEPLLDAIRENMERMVADNGNGNNSYDRPDPSYQTNGVIDTPGRRFVSCHNEAIFVAKAHMRSFIHSFPLQIHSLVVGRSRRGTPALLHAPDRGLHRMEPCLSEQRSEIRSIKPR